MTKGFACHKGLAARRRPRRPRPPRPPAAPRRRRHVDDGVVGRGASAHIARRLRGHHRRARPRRGRPSTSATRRRSTPSARTLHVGTLLRDARRAAHVLVGHAGLRQQVRRHRGRVRHHDRAPDPRPRAHRPVPHHRREPAGVAGQLLLDPQRARASCARPTARGARIVFVNPRRIETPERGVGDTVLIRSPTPTSGSSPRCSTRSTGSAGSTTRVIARHGTHVDGLRAFIADYPAERVAAGHRRRRRRRPRAGRGVGGHAAGVGPRLDRPQHGPPGHAGLLAGAHAGVRHRAPRRRGRQPQERRLLPQRPGRGRRRSSRMYVDTEFGRLRRGAPARHADVRTPSSTATSRCGR